MEVSLYNLSFVVLTVLTLFSAFMVATINNLARAIIFLVFFFLGGAGLYFLLDAPFLALVQVMVYAGAVAILFAFVVMLTPGLPGVGSKQSDNRWLSLVVAGAFAVVMIVTVGRLPGVSMAGMAILPNSQLFPEAALDLAVVILPGTGLASLGRELLGRFLLPFELVSLVLLVALVGAVVYTGRLGEKGGSHHDLE